MNIVDFGILGLVILGLIIGAKNGFTKQSVKALGLIVSVVFAFMMKGIVSTFLYQNLPFFKFGGFLKGVTILNILAYEVIGFLAVLLIATIVIRIVLMATGLLETLFNLTIILGAISKFLGALVGALEYFLIAFIFVYVASMPIFNLNYVDESKYGMSVLEKTPVLPIFASKTTKVVNDFVLLKDKYKEAEDANSFNLDALDLLLKYNITSATQIDELIIKGKLDIDDIESVLGNYR